MTTIQRLLLLGMFAGCGAAGAISLAVVSDPLIEDSHPFALLSAWLPKGVSPPLPIDADPGMEEDEAESSELPIASPAVTRPHALVAEQVTSEVTPPSSVATVPVSTLVDLVQVFAQRTQADPVAPTAPAPPAVKPQQEPLPPPKVSVTRNGNNRITLQLNNTPIHEVLDLISQASGLNIMATKGVEGTVTASLQDVKISDALDAILRTTGYTALREGEILYIGTAEELEEPTAPQPLVTRIYRPNYITAAELQSLVTSLLTVGVGRISTTSAAEQGIQADSAFAGGDNYADAEVVMVRDYESVLREIDQIFREVDRRPLQVAIEAMILSVRLNDSNKMGVDFELLRDRNDARIISGLPLQTLGQIAADGGLKLGFLNSNVSVFVEALEEIAETNVIATPRLLVLNKQKAEILIGSQLGYVSTTATTTALTQSVEFLEVGTQLRLRPFISSDGMVRMEVHPELSTGRVKVQQGFTLPDKDVTEVTTNIMVKDGATAIIGGLIREDLSSNTGQIPLFGSLPGIGFLFRQKDESVDRSEILVLITPRIVYDEELAKEGDRGAVEFHHRQAVVLEKFNPLTRIRISDNYMIKAKDAWAKGNGRKAMHYVNLAIHYNPESRAAIDLRADIWEGVPEGDHTGEGYNFAMPNGNPLDGPTVAPWLLDEIDPASPTTSSAPPAVEILHPLDPGQPGRMKQIQQ